jgi:hypothetical protein
MDLTAKHLYCEPLTWHFDAAFETLRGDADIAGPAG